MKLSHLLIAGAAAVSFSTIAADEKKSQQQPQAQSSGQSQSASGGATQSKAGQQSSLSQETIKQVQEKLKAAGYDVQVDGIMGPKTQAALKEYQQKQGLQASGQLDRQTLAALGVSEGAGASTGASADKSGASSQKSDSSAGASGGASAEPKSESKEKSKY